MESLVVGGGTLVNVNNHGSSPLATEDGLEEPGELALSKGDVAVLRPGQRGRQDKVEVRSINSGSGRFPQVHIWKSARVVPSNLSTNKNDCFVIRFLYTFLIKLEVNLV